MLSPEFLITAFVIVLAPGTGVIYTLATGLGRGRLASLAAAIGCTGATVLPSWAALIGLAAILHASALLFAIVKYAGVAYLLWLAIQTLRDRDRCASNRRARPSRWRGRPGAASSSTSSIPRYPSSSWPSCRNSCPASTRRFGEILVLGGIFVAMTFVDLCRYGLLAGLVRDRCSSSNAPP